MEEVREVANAVGRCETLKEYLGAKLVLVGEGIEIIDKYCDRLGAPQVLFRTDLLNCEHL